MKKYKILIVGMGTIAKRHIVNISEILNAKNYEFSIDIVRRDKNKKIETSIINFITNVFNDNESLDTDYDVIFITNPTFLHYQSIIKYVKHTKNMFIEKPLFDKVDYDISSLSLKEDGTYYVACPLRYTRVMQYILKNIDMDRVYSARIISSSYLPNWRPNRDYRQTYSAHEDKGGGVTLDLIHEWDYVRYLFGNPINVFNIKDRVSNLEITSDDISIYIAQYKNKLVEIHLDYFGKKNIRQLQLFTSEDTIEVDFIKNTVKYLSQGIEINLEEERNSYQKAEINYFFNIIEGISENNNTILDAYETLSIAKK